MLIWAVAAALGTAACYAAASVLQQTSARAAPPGQGLRLGLIGHLATRPLWLIGQLVSIAAVALHALALASGPLVIVQPLLVTGLLFALPAALLAQHRSPSAPECGWALLLVTALAGFLLAAHADGGTAQPDQSRLLALATLVLAGAATLVAVAAGPGRRHRGAILGAATGATHGLTAALLKTWVATADHGPAAMVTAWSLWALLSVGLVALVLNQTAFQAGPLAASLPPMTIIDPLVATAIGVVAFSESLATAPGALAAQLACAAAMAIAVVALARRTAGIDHRTGQPYLDRPVPQTRGAAQNP